MKTLMRFTKILVTIIRFRLDQLLLPRFLCISAYLYPQSKKRRMRDLPERRLRAALESLGPIFVKFGQVLSTRQDMLPTAFTTELAKLQDAVEPFPTQQAINIVERELRCNVADIFRHFSKRPLASASVAQVHSAILHNGDKVVVKILRPKIKHAIKRDIALMKCCACLLRPLISGSERLRLPDVIAEFEHSILHELDLMREAGNASQIRRTYLNSNQLYVPEVYWDLSSKQVLTLERIYGINIGNVKALHEAGVNMRKLAEIGIEIFFSQVLNDRFFHADMHPGNIFVDATDPENPKYIAIDFGIVGTLSAQDQRYIAENFLAFFQRDYGRVAQLHIDSGWVPADTRVDQFEMDIRAVCEPVFARPLADICFGTLLMNLFNTARKHHMTVQPQLILLQKTLFTIEALGRMLYPEINLWETAQPHLEKWVKSQVSLRGALKKTRQKLPIWLEKFPDLPELVLHALEHNCQQRAVGVPDSVSSKAPLYLFCGFLAGMLCCAILVW